MSYYIIIIRTIGEMCTLSVDMVTLNLPANQDALFIKPRPFKITLLI